MAKAWQTITAEPFDDSSVNSTLFDALVKAAKTFGWQKVILEDLERRPMTYRRLIVASLVLGRKLMSNTKQGERVGVMLPSTQVFLPVLFGLNAYGRVPALLNFTAGIRNISAACEVADLDVIVSSRRFVEHGKLDDVVSALEDQGRKVLYLEDVRETITTADKLRGMISSWFAQQLHAHYAVKPEQEAVILFTSGSEGVPKGVVLTNRNLLANAQQIAGRAAKFLKPDDAIFNPLPMFHSFGLTAGALLWLFSGYRVVLYPTPLHFRPICRLIAASGATILISTDTFSRHYARATEDDALAGIRLIVSGAEQVKLETRKLWEKYGTTILEGYGATECSPVLAVNLPDAFRLGSVGKFLPGVEGRLEPVEGMEDAGRLFVRGPNVMAGYLDVSQKGGLSRPVDGWYDTGDIVSFEDGFVFIRGRAKRFAKIAGEMVSLAAVEALVHKLWPDESHVVVALPDPRKGEQLVLITDREAADRSELLAFGKQEGFPELWIPRELLVTSIPVLGTGKVDYGGATELARTMRPLL